MRIHQTPITDLVVVESTSLGDNRGCFARLYCESSLSSIIGNRAIVQINYSYTEIIGTIRGLHFQYPPHAEMKLVRCLKGKIWDVAIDLRPNSSTYMCWHAQELSPQNAYMLVIPEGFAHGFQTLEAGCELLYLHTASFSPELEGGLRYDDPKLSITWPLPLADISVRDASHAYINSSFKGIEL